VADVDRQRGEAVLNETVQIRRAWPVGLAIGVLAAIVAVDLAECLRANGGRLIYAQDDPYIHLSIARTLAEHGTWGLTPDTFAPASSSPLWTVLLAALWRLGLHTDWLPFAINLVAAAGVLLVFDRALRRSVPDRIRAVALVATLFVIPLPLLVFVGMEHTVHIAVVLAFAAWAARGLTSRADSSSWASGCLLAFLSSGFRYEGLFVVAVVGLMFAWQRRWGIAAALLVAAAIPIAVYGAYAVAHGGLPLPNSILMKSGAARFGSASAVSKVLGDWVNLLLLYQRPDVAVLAVAVLAGIALGVRSDSETRSEPVVLAVIFVAVLAQHQWLVKLEWFYRYSAYLVALGALALTRAAPIVLPVFDGLMARRGRRRTVPAYAAIACLIVLTLPLARRAAEALVVTVRATHEVYLQQYQMARFFGEYYSGGRIALNDIGAVSWLAPVRIVDLVGLASNDVARARRRGEVNPGFFEDLVRRHEVAAIAVYDTYLEGQGGVPTTWHKAGEWLSIPNVAVSESRVSFYARTAEEATRLSGSLAVFCATIPAEIRCVGAVSSPTGHVRP
jgi:hypothetical protein